MYPLYVHIVMRRQKLYRTYFGHVKRFTDSGIALQIFSGTIICQFHLKEIRFYLEYTMSLMILQEISLYYVLNFTFGEINLLSLILPYHLLHSLT